MIGTLLTIAGVVGAGAYVAGAVNEEKKKKGDNRVKRGTTFFGSRYKTVHGPCYCCGGTGRVRGKTCRKCGGSGEYERTIWYD